MSFVMLLGSLAASASAGTLSWVEIDFTSATSGDFEMADGVWRYSCAATATANVTHATATCDAPIYLTIRYVGTATDRPPSNVTVSCAAGIDGAVSYGLLGRTPPSGSASASYSGDVANVYGYPAIGLSDSIGPVAQTASAQSANVPDQQNIGSVTVPTPLTSWSQSASGATITCEYKFLFAHPVASATADCTVNWKSSNAKSSWAYHFNMDSLIVG